MHHQFVRLLAVFIAVGVMSCGDDAPVDDAGIDAKTADAVCGNGKQEGDELCDGRDLGGEKCATVADGMYTSGTLSCRSDCTFNLTACQGADSGMDDIDADGGGGTGG